MSRFVPTYAFNAVLRTYPFDVVYKHVALSTRADQIITMENRTGARSTPICKHKFN